MDDIRIHRGEPNGPLCAMFRDELSNFVKSLPEFSSMKGPQQEEGEGSRPNTLPPDSIFLYAETGPESSPIRTGSICLIIHKNGSHNFKGLPTELDRVGEIKRMIILPEHRRSGVAAQLVEAVELIAREEMGLRCIVVETLWALAPAQAFYKRMGFRERGVWGGYVADDR